MNQLFLLFKDLPVVGKPIKRKLFSEAISSIDLIIARAKHPMVSFDSTIHDLYDCLKNVPLELENDFEWLMTLDISAYTKTSGEALELLQRVVTDERFKFDPFFHQLGDITREREFLDWHSNHKATQTFIYKFAQLLHIYCLEFPKEHEREEGQRFDAVNRIELSVGLMEFFNSRYFKLMLDDFLTVVRIAIHSQLRLVNDKAL